MIDGRGNVKCEGTRIKRGPRTIGHPPAHARTPSARTARRADDDYRTTPTPR